MVSQTSHLKRPHRIHIDNSLPVRPNNAEQPQARYDIVEDWLEETARLDPKPWPSTSQEHQKEVPGNTFPYKPFDVTSPYNKRPRRVDPRWSLRHDFPSHYTRQSNSPFETSALRISRKSTRKRTAPSDSSFISGFENTTRPPNHTPSPIPGDHVDGPTTKVPRDARLTYFDASSTMSREDQQLNFEKRPRRKTREDKYEPKKRKQSHEEGNTLGHSNHRDKKHKRTGKKKSMASSKNVVNNFTSKTVLNDRITVQPHLKPGLFDNGRASKKPPITDLTFSSMQFLKHQSGNIQPKPLSKSRIREKRREDREMEEVSSFFLPHRPDGNGLRSHKENNGRRYQKRERYNEQPMPTHTEKKFRSSPPNDHAHDKSVNGKDVGRGTTYFTWSSSRHSPRINDGGNCSSPDVSGSVRTTIPDSTRMDLIATGVYRNTGIAPYDDRLTEQNTLGKFAEVKVPITRHIGLEDSHDSPRQGADISHKVKYIDQGMMTEDPSTTSEMLEHPGGGSNQVVREVRLTPVERRNLSQHIGIPPGLDGQAATIHQRPEAISADADQNLKNREEQASEKVSVTSRDAMPPPPIPHSRDNSTAVPRANVEFIAPRQCTSPAYMEVSRVPQAVDYGNDTQDSREFLQSYGQNLTNRSVTNNGHILLTSNSASWVPQSKPSAPITGKGVVLSRLSTTSPTCPMNQDEGRLSRKSFQRDVVAPQKPESMAEFITRIENESQGQYLPHDYDIIGSGKAALEPSLLDTELPHEQPVVGSAGREAPLNLSSGSYPGYFDPAMPRIDGLYENSLGTETLYAQQRICTPRILPDVVSSLEGFGEERFDMSSFWRPNQFSRF
ncbi:hypothetical protein F5Y11DRAFT_355380 [Daldinia sp. FL1419]|nr:hypothetical protein F5Y11DRAFT_355380 [Daldinia sp. FL1419]